jgi:hypothetical protein
VLCDIANQNRVALRRIETGQSKIHEDIKSLSDDVRNYVGIAEIQKLVTWLCPLSSWTAQDTLETILRSRQTGTGTWILNTHAFKHWLGSERALLWITGLGK